MKIFELSYIHRIAIFASGAGSNTKKIIEYFNQSKKISATLIACNNPAAGVLNIAADNNIPVLMLEKENFFRGNHYLDELKAADISFIILAGFLWKMPPALIRAYSGKILNIHPALLPAYGGKGMYGFNVQKAVIEAREKQSGITIHFVDELYDHGKKVFQASCPVLPEDTPETLAARIHLLEHTHYARIIEQVILKNG